ncbi:MAG TPA: flagellin [Balneolales bacterium]|jgi:flagellin|nr:flagellin [Balneolales bacterium]
MSFGDLNRINTNVQSMQAQLSLNRINNQLANTQLQLSTGKRINKAEDDAAGFSIAAKLSSRIAGMNQALQNIGDAKSVLNIAEGSMNNVLNILNTMKSKATQAANGTIGTVEAGYINSEITSLSGEIDNIVKSTTYQNVKLLDGSYTATFQTGEASGDTLGVTLSNVGSSSIGVASMDVTTAAGATSALASIDGAINNVAGFMKDVGIYQSQLSIRQDVLSENVNNNSSALSNIQDTDFAKAQSESIKLQILQQTAISALSQANSAPQAVLKFIQ